VTYWTVGKRPVQAAYLGYASFASSDSAVLHQNVIVPAPAATTTALGSSADPSVTGQVVTLTAKVSPAPDGGVVSFRQDGKTIAGCEAVAVSSSGGQAVCKTSYGLVGADAITAVYSGDSDYTGSRSRSLTQTVHISATLRRAPWSTSGQVSFVLACVAQSGGCQINSTLTRRGVRVGADKLTVAAGASEKVTVALNQLGGHLLAKLRQLLVNLTLTLTADGQQSAIATDTLTIKPAIHDHRASP
jgi:hypothetical protein